MGGAPRRAGCSRLGGGWSRHDRGGQRGICQADHPRIGDPPSSGSPFRDRAPRLGCRPRTGAPRCCRRCRTAARVGQLRLSGLVDPTARSTMGRDPGVRRRHFAASRGGRRRRGRGPGQRRRRPRTQRGRHPSPAPRRARRCSRPGSGCRGDRIFERGPRRFWRRGPQVPGWARRFWHARSRCFLRKHGPSCSAPPTTRPTHGPST